MAMQLLNNVQQVTEFAGLVTTPTTSSSTAGQLPGARWQFVDTTMAATATVSSSQGDFGAPRKNFRAVVFVKSTIADTTSTGARIGPIIQLEAATSTAFATGTSTGSGTQTVGNIYVLDSKVMAGTATGAVYSFTLQGTVPFVAGCQFARVNFVTPQAFGSVASSTAVDIIIDAA
jgi:hypothetical protein